MANRSPCFVINRFSWISFLTDNIYLQTSALRQKKNGERNCSPFEFKIDAVSLVLDQGYSIPDAARSMDVGETALLRWLNQLKVERGGMTPTAKAIIPAPKYTLLQQKSYE